VGGGYSWKRCMVHDGWCWLCSQTLILVCVQLLSVVFPAVSFGLISSFLPSPCRHSVEIFYWRGFAHWCQPTALIPFSSSNTSLHFTVFLVAISLVSWFPFLFPFSFYNLFLHRCTCLPALFCLFLCYNRWVLSRRMCWRPSWGSDSRPRHGRGTRSRALKPLLMPAPKV